MPKCAQLIIGAAGSGKSTYCAQMVDHFQSLKRSVHVVNLDPAAEHFDYKPSIDIRELISLDDVMEELGFGPNGGLMYCIEYLLENLDWLEEELGDFQDDYLLFDCPGQIELYSHIPLMKRLVDTLKDQLNYRVCCVYMIDCHFAGDPSKLISGGLACLSAMMLLECSHVNVVTKLDLLEKKERKKLIAQLNSYFDAAALLQQLSASTPPAFKKLNAAFASLIEDYNLVSFVPLNFENPHLTNVLLQQIDNALQYGDDVEPKMPSLESPLDVNDPQQSVASSSSSQMM